MSTDIERKYQALFEQSPYGILLFDTAGRFLDVNETAHRDLGYTREEFAHLTVADIDPDESAADVKARISRILEEGGAEFEVRHRTKDGEMRDVHVIVKALVLSGQTVCHAIWRDITERKRTEGAIHLQSEIARNISEGIYLVSAKDLRIVYANPKMEEMFGYGPGEMNGRHVSIINAATGGDPVQTASQIEKALKETGTWRGEVLNVRKDGTPFWGHASISMLHHPEYGEVYVSLQTNITESKRAEEALRQSEDKFRSLFESATDAIFILDMQGNIIDVNRTAYERLGYTKEEMLSMHISQLDHRDFREKISERIKHMEQYGGYQGELAHLRKDGTAMPVEANARIMHVGGKKVILSVVRDIAERKKAEEALRESRALLQQILNTVPQSIFWKDRESVYLGCNAVFAKAVGMEDAEQIVGKTDFDLPWPKADAEAYRADDREVVANNLAKRHIIEPLQQAHGTRLWIDTTKVPLIDKRGQTFGVLGVYEDISERKRTEDAWRISEERLRQSVRVSELGIFDHDHLAETIYWSARQREIYGWDPDETVTLEGFIDCIYPEDRERVASAVRRAHDPEGDGLFAVEHRVIHRDGSIRWVTTRSQTFFSGEDGARKPVQTIGAVRDITEEKAAEDKIRQSEKRFHALFDNSPLGIVIVGPDRAILDCNVAFQKMLGYNLDELKALSVPDISHAADDLATRDHYRDMMEGKINSFTMEKRHIRKDGTTLWTNLTGTVVRDEKNAPQFVFGIVEDIGNRKKMEEDLRSSRDFIERILDTVDEAFIVIDRDYRIIMANSAYGDQVESPVQQIIGKRCYEISHQSVVPCYEAGDDCSVRHCFETGKPHSCLHKHTSKGGNTLYVETKAFPLKDSTGAVTSVIETVNNITDKHLLEEEQLKTQKLEAIGTLAGGIAHDFNNLLQGVFGYISMAKLMYDEKQKSLDMLEQAEKALHMSVNLTSQLLTFSKGGKPLTEKIALQPVIENSVKFALSGSRIDYRLEIAKELWMVEADEGQIAQVIQNLVLNAEQAMPMGGTITVTARNVSSLQKGLPLVLQRGNYIELSIKDSGIGIPEQYLPKIFDPYFTTKDKGSGLGLATCYSVIKNHGGLIDVKSKLGEGTVFLVYLPALEAIETSTAMVSEDVTAVRKGRILLMDDEDIVRHVAGIMIRSLGHEVEVVEDGKKVIARYMESMKTDRKFDIVIMDLTVRGEMGGEEAIKELLQIDPEVKAIVSSGYTDSAAISAYKSIGFRACLSKPYDIDSLNKTLNSLLD